MELGQLWRGIDFVHKFKTSRWAEDLILKSIDGKNGFVATRYGLSQFSQDNRVPIANSRYKEPDLLLYLRKGLTIRQVDILRSRDLIHEDRSRFGKGKDLAFVIGKAICAIEIEFSPYKAAEMKGRHWQPKTPEQWDKRPLKHAKAPIAPNIWVKEEDLSKLVAWERKFSLPIIITHLFNQEMFSVPLSLVTSFNKNLVRHKKESNAWKKLQVTRGIFKKDQVYSRDDAQGAGETKPVFQVTPAVAVTAGKITGVKISAQVGISASKKYVSHVLFSGGKVELTEEFFELLKNCKTR